MIDTGKRLDAWISKMDISCVIQSTNLSIIRIKRLW